ncbi:MAG: carotenoid biosynthesis protein, partial [Thermodesulfobacteriota bacterium]
MDLFVGTILLRPYVFAFLAVYLLGASVQFGYRVTLLFLPLGYLIAFASEYSSIHWGFPYGDYFYIPETVNRELWVLGVPFMYSLSYVFLAVCSYATALFVLSPFQRLPSKVRPSATPDASVPSPSPVSVPKGRPGLDGTLLPLDGPHTRRGWAPWLLGACLMVFLDIVIDPVALRGERWFLGKIYGYRNPGAYFGIPMSNFYGWLLVALVMIRVFQWLVARAGTFPGRIGIARPLLATMWGPVLYVCILLFNLAVTFAIGEVSLGIASSFITSALLV